MGYNREIHHRRSIRLKGFDYSSPGYYFITICTQNRECFFGRISQGMLKLNEAGKMIEIEWKNLTKQFNYIRLDSFIIMPNHLHGIINITGGPPFGSINEYYLNHEEITKNLNLIKNTSGTLKNSIGRIIQRFKSISTVKYIESVRLHHWPFFEKHLWQKNFHDHIIRNMEELKTMRRYIMNNPMKWESDKDNPII
jgi:REP element-mobilizing transposase RayT